MKTLFYLYALDLTIFLESGFKREQHYNDCTQSAACKQQIIHCLKDSLSTKITNVHLNHCAFTAANTLIASSVFCEEEGSIEFEFRDSLLLHIRYPSHDHDYQVM